MVTQKDTNVYLEAVEATEDKGKELNETRDDRLDCISERKHP